MCTREPALDPTPDVTSHITPWASCASGSARPAAEPCDPADIGGALAAAASRWICRILLLGSAAQYIATVRRGSRLHPAASRHAHGGASHNFQTDHHIHQQPSRKANSSPRAGRSDPVRSSAGCSSKVVLLEFAAVRRGSQADLACEEAPEASMHLEPLPTPRRSLSDALRHCCFVDAPMQPSATAGVDTPLSPRGKLSCGIAKRCMHLMMFPHPVCLLPSDGDRHAACSVAPLHHARACVKNRRHGPDLEQVQADVVCTWLC